MTATKKAKPEALEDQSAPAAPEIESVELEFVEVEFRGQMFVIPKDRDEWETEGYLQFLQAWEANQYKPWLLTAKLLLGPAQWTRLLGLGSKRKDFDDFLTVFIPVITEKCEG